MQGSLQDAPWHIGEPRRPCTTLWRWLSDRNRAAVTPPYTFGSFGRITLGASMRILTTHVGSLPRPKDLLDLMKAKVMGTVPGARLYEGRIRSAVAECVRRQAETGIDIVNDGEQ